MSINNVSNIELNADNLNSALCCISGIQTASLITATTTPEIIKEAERALLSWEQSNPSTYAKYLLEVMTKILSQEGEHVNTTPRLAAALSLKALVGRKWKDRGRFSKTKVVLLLDKDTKQQIRGTVLGLLTTNNFNGQYAIDPHLCALLAREKPFMKTLSSILAKIGSFDLPLEFKELVPTLVGYSIGECTPMESSIAVDVRLNSAIALEFTLGDICTKRLLLYKKYILSIASAHLPGLVSNGFKYSLDYLKASNEENISDILCYTTAMAKILNHLIRSTLSSLSDSLKTSQNDALDRNSAAKLAIDLVFQLLLEYIPILCNHLHQIQSQQNDDVIDQLKDLLSEFHSMVVVNQKAHPLAFARYLPTFLSLFTKDLEVMVSNKSSEDFLVIPRISFLANVISCSHYEPDETRNESIDTWKNEITRKDNTSHAISSKGDISIDPNSISIAIETVWSDYLTAERINSLIQMSLFFMTLKENMLDKWANDPEQFFIDRKHVNADDDVVACSQNLYLSLLESKCREFVIDSIGSYLYRVDEQLEAVNIEVERPLEQIGYESIVFWDAVYTILGLSFDVLKQMLNFDVNNWYMSCLSQVLKTLTKPMSQKPNRLPILRMRVLWLCGLSYLNQNETAFRIFIPLLQSHLDPEIDTVVQLSSIQALTNIVQDPPVTFASFLEFPVNLIESLYNLTFQFEEFESKSDCLTLIQLILSTCQNCGLKIDNQHQVELLIKPLESIWNPLQQNDFLMLRRLVLSILRTISAFGQGMSLVIYPIAFPLLSHALDCKNEENQFLVADSLDLLLTLIRVGTSYDSCFGTVFGRVLDILEQSFEHLKKLMLITEGYLLLPGDSFMQEQSSSIVKIFTLTLTQVSERGMAYVNLVLEALLKRNPTFGGSLLLSGGAIDTMIHSCAATAANVENCESLQVIDIYLTVFSRILLAQPTQIPSFINHLEKCNFGFSQLIDLYFMQFESNDSLRQTLWVMCLLSLLVPTGSGQISDSIMLSPMNLNKLLGMCLYIFEGNRTLSPYSVEYFYESDEDCVNIHEEKYENAAERLSNMDIGIVTNMKSLYSATMHELEKILIGSKQQYILQRLDQNLVNKLNEKLKS